MIRVFLLVGLSSGVFSQIQLNTTCVAPTPFPIDIEKFIGTWYQVARIPNSDETGDCSTTTFSTNGTTAGSLTNTEVVNKVQKERNGVINTTTSDFPNGKFMVTFNDKSTYEYHLLTSDYENFAVLYTCKTTNDTFAKAWAWKISKSKNLTAASELAISTLFNQTYPFLASANWRTTTQDGCGINGSIPLVYSPILALLTLLFTIKDVIY